MTPAKEVAAEERGDAERGLPSAGELRAMRQELSRLMLLTPAQLTARLDLEAATMRFRSFLAEDEIERALCSPQVEAAVMHYDAFCRSREDGSVGSVRSSLAVDDAMSTCIEVFEVAGSIKWFDTAKGYGFIVPDNGLADILLHVTCLRAGGYQTAYEGARVHCEVLCRPRGMQAFRILSMDESTAVHPSQPPQRTHVLVRAESGWQRAVVKWFNRVRGFGYLSVGEEHPDIFVHMETLRRFGFVELIPGQEVEVRWGQGSKGLMAAELRPLCNRGGPPLH